MAIHKWEEQRANLVEWFRGEKQRFDKRMAEIADLGEMAAQHALVRTLIKYPQLKDFTRAQATSFMTPEDARNVPTRHDELQVFLDAYMAVIDDFRVAVNG